MNKEKLMTFKESFEQKIEEGPEDITFGIIYDIDGEALHAFASNSLREMRRP